MADDPRGAGTPAGSPAAAALAPGLIWACVATDGAARVIDDGTPPISSGGFRWLHLNLADQRSHRWIEREDLMPAGVRALFLSHEDGRRVVAEAGWIALIVHDFERDFDRLDNGRIGTLRVAVGATTILTGRQHALQSGDEARRRILAGTNLDGPARALELILASVTDTLAARATEVSSALLQAEDELVAGADMADTRELVSLRRLCTRLHRVTGELRLTMQRLQIEAGVPDPLVAAARGCAERLLMIDADIAGAQAQLRLLRDELDLRAAQRTNQNIYVLSIMTALMMPATLVTGFFGMNTGGLPLSAGGGTATATIVAVAASAATYMALKLAGLTRR